jgi:6-phosphogluconolactonase
MVALKIVPSTTDLNREAMELILSSAREAFADRGAFHLCLAGGSTPKAIYTLLAAPESIAELSRPGLSLYWGDERCVGPDDLASNYAMAWESLIRHIAPAQVNVFRMAGEKDPLQSAREYENLLMACFPNEGEPVFDLLLLGMGPDGHTASLFPFTTALDEREHWVAANYVPALSAWRITLTPPLLNRSRRILFLASGEAKAAALAQVLTGEPNPHLYPAQLIKPIAGEVIWLVDRAAASNLP